MMRMGHDILVSNFGLSVQDSRNNLRELDGSRKNDSTDRNSFLVDRTSSHFAHKTIAVSSNPTLNIPTINRSIMKSFLSWIVLLSSSFTITTSFVPSTSNQQHHHQCQTTANAASSNINPLSSDIHISNINGIRNTATTGDETMHLLREELKSRLLKLADDYTSMKARGDKLALQAKEFDEQTAQHKKGYVMNLLGKIVNKVRRKAKNTQDESAIEKLTKSDGILTSDSFRQMKLDVGTAGDKIIELAEQLALLNPTPIPTLGFKQYGGVPSSESKLSGRWKLRFTTAADASFSESKVRGVATTSQVIDTEKGTLTNVVDFEKGKLKGFRVVVAGTPTSNTDIDLSFKKVKLLRESRFPRLFGEVSIWLPSRLIRWLASRKSEGTAVDNDEGSNSKRSGPYLQLRYLDDDFRMHTTDSGNWFIQSRLE